MNMNGVQRISLFKVYQTECMAHKENTSNKDMLDKRLFGKHNQKQIRSHGYGGVNFWHWYEF